MLVIAKEELLKNIDLNEYKQYMLYELKCKENLKVFDIKSIKSTEDMNVIANKILNISTKCNEK